VLERRRGRELRTVSQAGEYDEGQIVHDVFGRICVHSGGRKLCYADELSLHERGVCVRVRDVWYCVDVQQLIRPIVHSPSERLSRLRLRWRRRSAASEMVGGGVRSTPAVGVSCTCGGGICFSASLTGTWRTLHTSRPRPHTSPARSRPRPARRILFCAPSQKHRLHSDISLFASTPPSTPSSTLCCPSG
jgi:hypothetical protein